jgi:hypothetical protein
VQMKRPQYRSPDCEAERGYKSNSFENELARRPKSHNICGVDVNDGETDHEQEQRKPLARAELLRIGFKHFHD